MHILSLQNSLQLQQYHQLILLPPTISVKNTNITSEVEYLVNIPLLYKFFRDKTLNNLLGDKTLKKLQEIDLPDFSWYQHNLDDKIAKEHKLALDRNKVSDLVKEDHTILKSMEYTLLAFILNYQQTCWLPESPSQSCISYVTTIVHIHFPIMITFHIGYTVTVHMNCLKFLLWLLICR